MTTQSGHLHSYSECVGEELLTVLCSLEHIEEFYHRRTNSTRTDFGQMELMKLVSSWPNLKIVCTFAYCMRQNKS